METNESFYETLYEVYRDYIEEDQYTPLQSFYYMIEVFAVFITKSKQNKVIFYEAMKELMKNENIDESACYNFLHSYEMVMKQAKNKGN